MPTKENTTDIIIVKYNRPDYERECVQQVVNTVPNDYHYHLTVYDNYPKDKNLSVVWNEQIEASDADFICLLNNDTVPNEGWFEKLLSVFDKKDDVGAVGPVSNTAGTIQGGFTEPLDDEKIEPIGSNLSGFCMMFPKDVWEEVGGFDEKFELYGEDSDFSVRIKNAGYKLYVHFGAYIYHYGRKSTPVAEERGKNLDEIKDRSVKRFREKNL